VHRSLCLFVFVIILFQKLLTLHIANVATLQHENYRFFFVPNTVFGAQASSNAARRLYAASAPEPSEGEVAVGADVVHT
jgi:hypothetical protein